MKTLRNIHLAVAATRALEFVWLATMLTTYSLARTEMAFWLINVILTVLVVRTRPRPKTRRASRPGRTSRSSVSKTKRRISASGT
jgi:hypothetical protein